MDSGASTHMTSDQGILPTYFSSSLHNSSNIVVGNGSTLPVLGMGSTYINSPNARFVLSNVLHTPHLIKNLISVRKFTRDNACLVEFDPNGFSVKDLHTKKEIMRSSSGGDLYSFGSHKITAPLALTASSSSAEMWHRRLGHPGQYSLARLVSDFLFLVPLKLAPPVFVMHANEAAMFASHFLVPLHLHIFLSK
jgi:hypothetical protein